MKCDLCVIVASCAINTVLITQRSPLSIDSDTGYADAETMIQSFIKMQKYSCRYASAKKLLKAHDRGHKWKEKEDDMSVHAIL